MRKEHDIRSDKQKRTQEFTERRALFLAAVEVLKAKKNFLILTFLLATFGTLIGHYFQESTYSSAATIFVQTLEDPTAAEYLLNQRVGRSSKADRIDTYMRYLSSDAFFVSVAQKMKFQTDIETINLQPPQALSLVNPTFWVNKSKAWLSNDSVAHDQHIKQMSLDTLVSALRQITSFETDYSHFIHVKTKTLDPRAAQIIANLAAEEFVNITNARGIQEIEQIKEFVKNKIEETEERIKKNEVELIDFKKKNSIISTDTNSNLIADRYNKIASQLESAKLQFEENQKLIVFFERGQKKNMEESTPSISGTQVYGAKETALILQKKIEQLKREKALIIAQEDKNQEYRLGEIDLEINKTLKAFKVYSNKSDGENLFLYMNPQKVQQKINELKEENEVLKNKIATNSRALDEVKSQIEGIPYLAQKQLMLENTLKLDTENFSSLKNKQTELEIQRISQKKEVRIDQMASLPAASPKGSLPLKLTFSTLIALLLGMSIIIGIEMIDPTVKHRSDLNDCGIEFIGEIPLIDSLVESKNTSPTPKNIICNNAPESIEAMAFKYIRARLESYKYKFKKDHLLISVSSSAVHEGKSFTTANIAVSIANLKRSVLLIDADLRRPSQNAYFDVNPEVGLVDLLNVSASLDQVLIPDVVPGLDYIPAGRCTENPTEYISSEKFKALLNHLRPQYDYILIDTPPVFAAVDSSIIASYCDIPILLANFRETKKYHLNEAYSHLIQVSYKKVYGIINKAIVSTTRFHYYGYHSYGKANDKSPASQTSSPANNSTDIEKFLDNLKKKSS